VGTANVGFRAPACLTFYCSAAREGAHYHTRQTPLIRARLRSGNRSGDPSGGDHIPNSTFSFASASLPLLFDEASFSVLISGDVDTAAVSNEDADSRLVSGSNVGLIASLLKEVARCSTQFGLVKLRVVT
jgi:hypothetical protein